MKILKNFFQKNEPHFENGGKYQRFRAVFDMFYTGLFVPDKVTEKGTHIRDGVDLKRAMFLVVVALIPALLFGMWNTGYQHFLSLGQDVSLVKAFMYGLIKVLPIVIVAYVAGGAVEVIFAQRKGHEVNEGFLVTGMLIPLIVPADIPLWMLALATIFATLIGKEVFGGTGMNFVNPALLTRAFLFFAYPASMSGDTVWVSGLSGGEGIADGFSGATPLAHAAAHNIDKMQTSMEMFIGNIPGSVGETSVIAILIGAVILLFTGIASWKTMFSVVAGGLVMGGIFNYFAVNPYMEVPAWQHLLMGGFAFGAVFMATDPVTSAQTESGKWIYGFLIGVVAILVRVLNPAYPEGMMLAILLMNVFAPLIDYYIVEANIKRRLKRAKVKA